MRLLLIDYINLLRERGMGLIESIKVAGDEDYDLFLSLLLRRLVGCFP